jgi:chromatin remodeling complex protein RSC6
MVRSTKSTAAPTTDKPAAPAAKKTKSPKETPVAAPATPAAEQPPVADIAEQIPLLGKLGEFAEKLQQMTAFVSSLKTEYKALEKVCARELKAAQKASLKKKRASGNRAPSGFVKPTLISDELAAFLGKEKGSEVARTTVSKEINAYIRAAKLQDPTNGRKINPDAKLAKLLKIGKGDELTYFNLQRYMKHHFIKTTPSA